VLLWRCIAGGACSLPRCSVTFNWVVEAGHKARLAQLNHKRKPDRLAGLAPLSDGCLLLAD
jgi:hypothetical protein